VRWLLVLFLAAVGVGLGGVGLLLLRGEQPVELLPDLDQAAPSALSVVQVGDTYRLTFLSAVDNVGRGPLLVEGDRGSRAEETMSVRQLLRSSDGSERALHIAGVMRYVRSETHAHWHLLDFERYELRRASDGELVEPDRKTGFCLGDRYDAAKGRRLPNEPDRAVWTEECGRNQPELLRVSEGISPGYGDDYVPRLEGQWVDITSLRPGRYVLVHRANPERELRESDYRNNAASVLVELGRPAGEIPTIRVVARCPGSERCPNA
jgi:Lysyl oxidase